MSIKNIVLAAMALPMTAAAQMPIVQTEFTADPAPVVYGDTIYLYTTHDEDDADGFKMKDWLLYTSTDMVNWQNHGAVASLRDFKWYKGNNGAWAEQVIKRNGKYYMYCPIHGNGIGVLVSDTPYGPFIDPIGKPLVWQREHWNDIDPTVWIDDDGQAYMYWGNPILYHIKLNEDMISTSGDIVAHPKIEDYQEGPWFWKRNGNYYLAFASTCCPEGIGYAMSKGPEGPWEYKGHIMNHTPKTRGNHPGIIDYKGKSYVFGLNYDLLRLQMPEHHERRSVSVAEMHYNADGTIQEVPYFKETAIEPAGTFNPYQRVEAETMAWGWGLKTMPAPQPMKDGKPVALTGKPGANRVVTNIDEGETLTLRNVDFGTLGARTFTASVSSLRNGAQIEIRLDRSNGEIIGVFDVPVSGNLDRYVTASCDLNGVTGIHDLVFRFVGTAQKDLFRWDWWQMGTYELQRPVPQEVRQPARQQGTLETFDYTVVRDGKTYNKQARVYLPYGYAGSKQKYNVLYLMHGGGDNMNSFLTPPQDWLPLSQVLDHLIEQGKMEPIIVVAPTFYGIEPTATQAGIDGPGRPNGLAGATAQVEMFHEELAQSLIPAVEKKYRTYYKGDIAKSRDHRAFGGFSMGALCTWFQLAHGVDAVSRFLPLSGDLWIFENGQKQSAEAAAKWLDAQLAKSPYGRDFTVRGYTGTTDLAGNPQRLLTEALWQHAPLFAPSEGRLSLHMMPGGQHYYGDINQYLWYALPLLWSK